jgi:hypothetical protein
MKKFILPLLLLILLPGGILIDVPDDNVKNGVYMAIDPRMELLAIVQHFTTWAGD